MTAVTDDLLFQRNPSTFLLYVADNLAYLPYNTQEEPLFVVHHIDMTISVTGSNLLQQFKEACFLSTMLYMLACMYTVDP